MNSNATDQVDDVDVEAENIVEFDCDSPEPSDDEEEVSIAKLVPLPVQVNDIHMPSNDEDNLSIEERLEAAEKLLKEKDEEIKNLTSKLDKVSAEQAEMKSQMVELTEFLHKVSKNDPVANVNTTSVPVATRPKQEKGEGYVSVWQCDTYNDCYNFLYDKFVSNPDDSFTKEELKQEWLSTEPKNKTQVETSLNRLIVQEFIDRNSKSYQLSRNEIQNGIRNKEDLFTDIGADASTSRKAKMLN